MWREHDAKLASAWRRDELPDVELDNVINLDRGIDRVIVLPDQGAPGDAPDN